MDIYGHIWTYMLLSIYYSSGGVFGYERIGEVIDGAERVRADFARRGRR